MLLTRRSLFGGVAALLAAPAIVRVQSIMPVKAWSDQFTFNNYLLGQAAGDRVVIVGVASGDLVKGVTIGGRSAHLVSASVQDGGYGSMWRAGADADVVDVTVSMPGDARRCGVSLWSLESKDGVPTLTYREPGQLRG